MSERDSDEKYNDLTSVIPIQKVVFMRNNPDVQHVHCFTSFIITPGTISPEKVRQTSSSIFTKFTERQTSNPQKKPSNLRADQFHAAENSINNVLVDVCDLQGLV